MERLQVRKDGPRNFWPKQRDRPIKFLIEKRKVPTSKEYDEAIAKNNNSGDNIDELNNLNKKGFENIISSINHT